MKRLFIKLTIIMTVALLVFIPANNLVKHSRSYNINDDILAFKKDPHPVDIINLGASHSMYGYYFKPTGLTHLDLALPSQTLQYDFKLLKEYGKHLKPDGVVLISISQITFANAEIENVENYYEILDHSEIEPFRLTDYYRYLYFPGTQSESFTSALSSEMKKLKWDSHQPWANDGKNYAARKYDYVEGLYRAAEEENYFEQNLEQLKELLDYCQENGYQAVLTMEPVHQTYETYFDEAKMDKFVFQYLDTLETDVPFLNHMNDPRFADNKDYFIDSDHLNSEGRKKYSWIIYEELKELGYF